MAHLTGESGQIVYNIISGSGLTGGTPDTSRLFMWDWREIRRMADFTRPNQRFREWWPHHRTGILQFGGYIEPNFVDLSTGFNERAPFIVTLRPDSIQTDKKFVFNGWLQEQRVRVFVDQPSEWFGTIIANEDVTVTWT